MQALGPCGQIPDTIRFIATAAVCCGSSASRLVDWLSTLWQPLSRWSLMVVLVFSIPWLSSFESFLGIDSGVETFRWLLAGVSALVHR